MHELSIAMSIIDVVGEESARRGAARILAVHLRLGKLSGVVREALVSAWELARERTPLEDARLVIEEVDVVAHCPTCQVDIPVASIQRLCCPVCESPTPDIVRGRELEVTALEIGD